MIDLQPHELQALHAAARAHPLLLELIADPPHDDRTLDITNGGAYTDFTSTSHQQAPG